VVEVLMKLKVLGTGEPLVRETWSLDCQNHGDSAVLNAAVLEDEKVKHSVWDLATAIRAFVASERFSGHQIVGIGHSFGSTAIVLSTIPGAIPAASYKALVIVEQVMCDKTIFYQHLEERRAALGLLGELISARRDEWDDRAATAKYFKKRFPWKLWDPQIMDKFIEYGLKDVVSTSPDGQPKVTLKCSKTQERLAYNENDAHFIGAERLATLDALIPVHCVFGKREDSVPRYVHDSVVAKRKMASVSYVPRAGHLVLQENPRGLADRLAEILYTITGGPQALVKL